MNVNAITDLYANLCWQIANYYGFESLFRMKNLL